MISTVKMLGALGMTRSAVRFVSALGMTAAVIAGLTLPTLTAEARRADVLPHSTLPHTGALAYTAQAPNRILDTRSTGQRLTGGTLNLTVAGGTTTVPATAGAVVLNVTVTGTVGAGFLTVWPAGSTQPGASSLNWAAGETRPNLVTVPVGTAGQVSLFANSPTDVVVDEEGYYGTSSGSAGGYVAVTPARITDTRTGSGFANAGSTLGAGSTLSVQVTGAGGVPATGVSGVVVNATVTNTTGSSFLTVWPAGGTMPTVSNLNWVPGWTVPNRVTVPVGTGGKINVFNKFGSADVVVDVDGYYTDATASGKLFTPQSPSRVIDTRIQGGTLGAGGSSTYQVTGFAGVPPGATAVIFNTTVTNTTAASFLTVYPGGGTRPLSSDLNWVAGQTIPNLTLATLSSTGSVSFFNFSGSTDLVVDLFGFFGQQAGVTITASPGSVPADGKSSSQSTVTVTVVDANGNAVAGDAVNFTFSGSPSGACNTTLSPAPPYTTNSSGQVVVTYQSNTTAGTCTITATEANRLNSASTTITQTQVANTVAVSFGTNPVPASTSTTTTSSTVMAKVTDVTGANVLNDTVTFTMSPNPAGSCGTLSASSASTGSTGTAQVTYTTSTSSGFCTITATEAATAGSNSGTIDQETNPAPTTPNTVTNSPTAAPLAADGKSTQGVTVTVKNSGGGAISGDPVMFTLSGTDCGTISPTFATTDASGTTSTTYTAASTGTAGTCTITAQESQGAAKSTTPTTITHSAVANVIVVTATPSTLPADGTTTSNVVATVTSGVTGAPVKGDLLTISATGAACGTLGTASGSPPGTTDANGKTTVTYKAGTTSGFCTVKATDAGNATGGSATITQTTPSAPTVTITASPSSIPASGKATDLSLITATVKTSTGGPVNGDPVNFTLSGAACGTVTATPVNTVNGQSQTTYHQPTTPTPGVCTVTATEANAGASASATVTQTQVANTVAETFGTNPVPASTSTSTTTSTVMAKVTDVSGANVLNDTVTFTMVPNPAGSCGTLSSSTASTGSTGTAQVTYTTSTSSGFCTITATEAKTSGSDTQTIDQETNPAPTTPNTVTNSPTATPMPADGATTATITAVVKNSGGGAISGDPVMWTLSGTNCGSLSTTFGTTDASGSTSTIYKAAATGVAGPCTVTAQESEGAAKSTTPTTVTQTAVNNSITISASPSTVSVSGGGTSTVTVTVTNAVTGKPIATDTVNFLLTGNPAAACGSLAVSGGTTGTGNGGTAAGTTDANGKVTATYTTSSSTGFCTIKATETGTAQSASTTITQST
jgi:hypothetical protein